MRNPSRSLAILFVDDEAQARKYFVKAFGKEFRIFTAESVAEARQLLAELHAEIGLLVTDQRMPNENGVVLLREVKQQYPHILRILTTAYSDLNEAIEAVNAGEIMRYIQKPWDLAGLKSELTYALRYAHTLRERDQLYYEKLGVRQRLIAINRVRDLVVMAGSFTHLRSPLAAIQSFLLQQPIISEGESEQNGLDMWALMEQEIETMLSLSAKIRRLTQGATESYVSVSVATLLESFIQNELSDIHITSGKLSNDLPQVGVEPHLIKQALCLLIKEVAALNGESTSVQIDVSGNGGNVLMLSITAPMLQLDASEVLKLSAEMLSVFLIIYHHSGDIRLADHAAGFEIVLPVEPQKVELAAPPAYWLNDVLSSFEAPHY